MNNAMKRHVHSTGCRWLLSSLLCCLLFAGCADEARIISPSEGRDRREAAMRQEGSAAQPNTEIIRRDVLMPAKAAVNNRIQVYEQKLREWQDVSTRPGLGNLPQERLNQIDECRAQLQHLLIEYTSLRQQLEQETRIEAAQLLAGNSLLQLNQQDIEYLEGGCDSLYAQLKASPDTAVVVGADPRIKAAYDNGDYDQVINLYGQQNLAPGQVPAVENTYQYAQSLLKNHQESEARRVLADLPALIRRSPGQDTLFLEALQLQADLDFALGAFDSAKSAYEELIRLSIEKGAHKEEWAGLQLAALQPGAVAPAEMGEYGTLLRNYLSYSPKRDGYAVSEQAERYLTGHPGSRLTPNVTYLQADSRRQVNDWLNQGIKRIEGMANDRLSQEAPRQPEGQAPIIPLEQGRPPVSEPQAQPPSTAQTSVNQQGLQNEYDRGVALLEGKEYDKAIEHFNRLLPTAYADKARQRIEEASKMAAQDMRQKAAELFVRATGNRDTDEKRKLLLSARDLLQSILTKYPQSGLTDKVQRNITRVDSELRTLEGAGGARPVSSGGAYLPPKPGGSAAGTGGSY